MRLCGESKMVRVADCFYYCCKGGEKAKLLAQLLQILSKAEKGCGMILKGCKYIEVKRQNVQTCRMILVWNSCLRAVVAEGHSANTHHVFKVGACSQMPFYNF
jgi:hypothetical protein